MQSNILYKNVQILKQLFITFTYTDSLQIKTVVIILIDDQVKEKNALYLRIFQNGCHYCLTIILKANQERLLN